MCGMVSRKYVSSDDKYSHIVKKVEMEMDKVDKDRVQTDRKPIFHGNVKWMTKWKEWKMCPPLTAMFSQY